MFHHSSFMGVLPQQDAPNGPRQEGPGRSAPLTRRSRPDSSHPRCSR